MHIVSGNVKQEIVAHLGGTIDVESKPWIL